MRLQDITDRQNAIRAELASMDEDPNTTEEDHGDLRDSLIAEYENLTKRAAPIIDRLEKIKVIQRAEGNGGGEPATGPASAEFMRRTDPWEDLDRVRNRLVSRDDAVSRALTGIELHAKRGLFSSERAEAATVKAQHAPNIARHLLLTGSEEYIEAFRRYLEDPTGEVARAALSLTQANGGYLLPYILDPTIVLTNDSSANPFRRISNVKNTTSNAWQGVSSAGVNAAWLGEATTAADASPTVGQIQVYPKKAAAWVFGSFEVLEDTNFGDQLPGLLSDAKDRLEEAAFAVGTGGAANAGTPKGVLVAMTTGARVAANSATGAFYGTGGNVDVYNLQAGLAPRWRASRSCAWVATLPNINKIRSLDQYGGSSFWANFGSDTPEQLLGKPIYESTSIMSATGTGTGTGSASLVFGDWSQFYIVDRIGTSMLYDPLVKGTGAASNTPSGQSGWFYFWRVGSDVSTTAAFKYLSNG